jgi:hypothetical protein
VLIVPSLVYSANVMTESLAYPIFLWAMLALQRALERPLARRQVEVLLVIALAALSRAQMVVLLPAFVTAVVATGLLGRDEPLRAWLCRFRLTWWTLAALAAGGAAATASASGTLLGMHSSLGTRIDLLAAPRQLVWHLAELDLAAGVVPLVGFVLLAAGSRAASRTVREFVVSTGSVTVWLLGLVAIYSTVPAPRPIIHERYLFYLVPLFVLAFFAWIRDGLPMPRGTRPLVVMVVALPLAIPFGNVFVTTRGGVNSATVGLIPWGLAHLAWDSRIPAYAGTGIVCAAAVLMLATRPSGGRRLVVAVVSYFLAVGTVAQLSSWVVADAAAREAVGQPSAGWIDDRTGAGGDVGILWTTQSNDAPNATLSVWESAFFNRSINQLYSVDGAFHEQWAARRLELHGTLAKREGRPFTPRYVLADSTARVRGTVVGHDRCTGLTLYRVIGPLRVVIQPARQRPSGC